MSIWNKILVGLIVVASLVLFYMAMWTLKTHQYWADLARRHEQRIEQLKTEAAALEPEVRQARVDLNKLLLNRRRAWFHCDPKIKVAGDTAEIAVTIPQPLPHGIAAKTVLYAFDETNVQNKGQYLGEFVASKVGDKQATLVPTSKLTPREIDRLKSLARTKHAWTLYEIMPRDNHDLFAGLSDDLLKAMLPPGSVSEYIKDGKPAAPDDPKDFVKGGKYVRPLWDFDVLFGAERQKRILLTDELATSRSDNQLVDEALADARKQEEGVKRDIVVAKTDVEGADRQRDEVADYGKKLADKLAAMQSLVAQLIATNQAMAGQIAKFQLEAARQIDQRTAQSGAERR